MLIISDILPDELKFLLFKPTYVNLRQTKVKILITLSSKITAKYN